MTNLFRIQRRNFWTVSRASVIGYIEAVGSNGFIFENDCINFRETSSNLSTGSVLNVSMTDCNIDKNVLKSLMNKKIPVNVCINQQLLSIPTRGEIVGQIYAEQIEPIENEIISTKREN
jgi:hypothetical protein